jgi:hypothetical protein
MILVVIRKYVSRLAAFIRAFDPQTFNSQTLIVKVCAGAHYEFKGDYGRAICYRLWNHTITLVKTRYKIIFICNRV